MMFSLKTRKNLTPEQCDELWHRILRKKRTYTFGRDQRFINRCEYIQSRLSSIELLWRYRKDGIDVDCPLEANIVYLKRLFGRGDNASASKEN